MDPLASTATLPAPLTRLASTAVTPQLSVVVVNYRQWRHTIALVRQLRAAAGFANGSAEVVLVDNHSPPHRVLPRLRRLSGVSLRRWRRNRGFARAVNEGVRLSRGEWFLLLNPDVSVEADFLDRALAYAERLAVEEPRAGIVGFRLRDPDGGPQHSAGPFPTLFRTLARLLLPRARRKYLPLPGSTRRRVDWVTGCCLLIRRECWEQVGGLDADYFLYYEDVDLCRRAAAAGWSVWHEPGLSVVHHHPLHGRIVSPLLRLITRHALLTYARKHWPAWQALVLGRIVGVETWLRRLFARRRGDVRAAGIFARLQRIVRDFAYGRTDAAGRRLRQLVREQEDRRAAASLHRDSQS
jgi:GT2 family glycosyltransferase